MTRLEDAQALDARGLNVLPARGKAPTEKWERFQHERTTLHLTEWFKPNGSKPLNLWVACGKVSGVIVLDCDNAAAWKYWHSKIGAAMDTTTCVKTSKGAHYWFRITGAWPSWSVGGPDSPPDEPRFDVKGEGGGVIAPPSVHENGHVYSWLRGLDQLQPAPAALRKPKAEPKQAAPAGLAALLAGTPKDPGKGNVWMTSVAGHIAKAWPFRDGYEALVRLANRTLADPIAEDDIAKLIDSIWDKESEKAEASGVWEFSDLAPILDGSFEPERPQFLVRTDGQALLYSGRKHLIAAETETGKSWLLLLACKQAMAATRHVVWVDFEDDEVGTVQRLLAMGTPGAQIREFFHYTRPEVKLSKDGLQQLIDQVGAWSAAIVVCDGVTEAAQTEGLKVRDENDIAEFYRRFMRQVAKAGAATVGLDHVARSHERGERWALGSQHKVGGLDGASFGLESIDPMGVGLTGRSLVTLGKDRRGQLRRAGEQVEQTTVMGTLVVTSTGESGGVVVSLVPPTAEATKKGLHSGTPKLEAWHFMERKLMAGDDDWTTQLMHEALTKDGHEVSERSVRRAFDKAAKAGVLKTTKGETVRDAIKYRMKRPGQTKEERL